MWKFMLWILGWKVDTNLPKETHRCVMIAAPHTSNWDFLYMMLAFKVLKIDVRFTIKDSFFKFPFNLIVGPLGGIAIDRSPKKEGEERISLVEAMAALFAKQDKLVVIVTPEGTRSKRTEWKSGFYHVAKMANVPVCLGYLDFKTKIAGVGKAIQPTDYEENMREIMAFYKPITPAHPDKFGLDERFI